MNDYKRRGDEVMIEIQSDIKELKVATEEITIGLSELTTANKAEHHEFSVGLFGNKKFNQEGLVNKVARHEVTIQLVERFFNNAKLLWVIAGIMGLSTTKDIIDLVAPVLKFFIEKALAAR